FDDVDGVGGLLGAPQPPAYSVVGLTDTLVRDQVIVFADGAAPAKKLLEVLSAIPEGAVVAIAHEGRAAALPLVFEGGAALLGNDLGDPDPDRVALVVEVAADSYLVGATRVNDLAKVNAGDTTGLRAALDTHFKSGDLGDRRDVEVTVQDEAKVAQLVPALDAALGAGARVVRVQTPSPDSGFGPGGTGTGWGTIGTGRYGTIGGTIGGGQVGPRGTAPAGPSVSIGQPNAAGDLDKAIIRRYIKRNIQKITYCYEKALLTKPSLAGTVTAKFFIAPNGSVASSEASGVDPTVASCVAQVIKGIEFPKPKGGGGVQVNYPFTFRSAQK
ncbi:MAG: AgmX/PglI C-terminal domain-containing protein, partial [Kofleriaceae bacterium]